jgi:thiamine biosynthesis lipoprotein
VGVEPGGQSSKEKAADFELRQGGVATSGDANRYLEKDDIRYSHVLNPRTGWPVIGAPRAITVAAANCTDAGMLSTLALLQGAGAEDFLREQDAPYWCQW